MDSFNGDLLYEPWEVYDEGGLAFTTFDSYWAKCTSLPIEPALHLPPWKLVPPKGETTFFTKFSRNFEYWIVTLFDM